MKLIRIYPLTLFAAAALVAAVATVALAAGHVPPRDSFRSTLITGHGRFARDNGHVLIEITAPGSASTRTATLRLSGRRCGTSHACIRLRGTLTGTLTRVFTIPDVGQSFTLSASGRVGPLGHVSATGQVHGTGFIMNGHETLTLNLSNSHGSVQLQAQSPQVPGFTSP